MEYYTGKNVVCTGDITFHHQCSIWHNAVLRADTASINIGENTNIQDLSMIHAGDGYQVTVGQNVTVGHCALLHGCTIEDHCLIGMGSIIMNQARIQHHSIVGAGSLITQGKQFPPYSLIMGSPAKWIRNLSEEEIESIDKNAVHYVQESKKQLTVNKM